VYPVATAAADVHVTPLATTLTLFVAKNPVPVTCTTHDDVIGQSFVMVRGPFNVKTPTSNEKSVFPLGSCAQQSLYRAPEVPPVVSDTATA
jgi:hypothetical protein